MTSFPSPCARKAVAAVREMVAAVFDIARNMLLPASSPSPDICMCTCICMRNLYTMPRDKVQVGWERRRGESSGWRDASVRIKKKKQTIRNTGRKQLTLEKARCRRRGARERRQRRHVTALERCPVIVLVVIARKHPAAYKLYTHTHTHKYTHTHPHTHTQRPADIQLRHATQGVTREGKEGQSLIETQALDTVQFRLSKQPKQHRDRRAQWV